MQAAATSPELDSVWSESCAILRASGMSETSYKMWFAPIKPLDLNEDKLMLEVEDDFVRKALIQRYSTTVGNAACRAARRDVVPVFLSRAEADSYRKKMDARMRLSVRDGAASPPPLPLSDLNPNYTFDSFVIGASNRFAHAASLAVAQTPAQAYNPLFIYGGVGLGKTHLMQAIAHYIIERNGEVNLVYTSSENFTNELIYAIQTNKNKEFRERYRRVDVLMIDDIQFIAGHMATQEELFHTFNTLHQSGKQIIISSDKQPKEIPGLEERLRSRFEWGLIADIQRPDLETRIAILRKKAEREVVSIPEEVHQFIAVKVESNIRELEGSLTRVIAYASLVAQPITVALAEDALKEMLAAADPRHLTPRQVMAVVGDYFGVSVDDLMSQRRDRKVSVPRQICMFVLRDLGHSLPNIGLEFGGRDHSTVIHAINKVGADLDASPQRRNELADIRKKLLQ